jgi:hypothetical protein
MLIGAVWILQGSGILPGSAMSGDVFWARVGAAVLVAGAVACGLGLWLGTRPGPR